MASGFSHQCWKLLSCLHNIYSPSYQNAGFHNNQSAPTDAVFSTSATTMRSMTSTTLQHPQMLLPLWLSSNFPNNPTTIARHPCLIVLLKGLFTVPWLDLAALLHENPIPSIVHLLTGRFQEGILFPDC